VLMKALAGTPGPVREIEAPAMYEPTGNSTWTTEVKFSATSKPIPFTGTKPSINGGGGYGNGAGGGGGALTTGATEVTNALTP